MSLESKGNKSMNDRNNWTRREFIQGIGSVAAGLSLSACANSDRSSQGLAIAPQVVEQIIDPRSLEKPDLNVGFVPVNDCAPFAIAWSKGFFHKYGLNVTLSREASWATSRDGVIFGRLDAAPVVSGAVTNARIGAEGARHAPLCAAMTIHRHGNAITMNKSMWDFGLRPWHKYKGDLGEFEQQLHSYFEKLPLEDRILAVVLSSSIYEYFIRYLTAATGFKPDEEFRLIIFPPPQMVSHMRLGAMQAYMVAEPWNTRAMNPLGKSGEGVGFTFAQGKEIWHGHPDRLLAVMESFIEENPKTYRSLVKAIIEACQYCSDPNNRPEVAKLITDRSFTGARPRTGAVDKFTRPGIVGEYNYGGFDGQPRTVSDPHTTVFFDLPNNVKHIPGDHSTFLWQSQSLWLMTQAARWGQIREFPKNAEQLARKGWRTDLYREIAKEMGIECPSEDYKVEPAEAFIDRKIFDPSDPVGYIKSFAIRTNGPQSFFVS
jgi:nitrate/nitrite transport system substrate-binding protein